MPSLFHHIKQAREANIANQIKTEREGKADYTSDVHDFDIIFEATKYYKLNL